MVGKIQSFQNMREYERHKLRNIERRIGRTNLYVGRMNSSSDTNDIESYPPIHIIGRYWVRQRRNNYHAPDPSPFTIEVMAKVGARWVVLHKSGIYYDCPDGYHIVEAHNWVSGNKVARPREIDENGKGENLWRWMKKNNITEERIDLHRKRDL